MVSVVLTELTEKEKARREWLLDNIYPDLYPWRKTKIAKQNAEGGRDKSTVEQTKEANE